MASRQHGVVGARQLLDAGLSRKQIERRLSDGLLHRVHAGVFAAGHSALGTEARLRAATLAFQDRAWVSHLWAARLWGFWEVPSGRWIDVLVVRGSQRRRRGIYLRRTRWLPDDQRTLRDGIPVTSAERTLLDLAGVLPPKQLQRAFEEADRLRLIDRVRLEEVLKRSNGRRGTGKLAALVIRQKAPVPKTRSNQEMRMYRLCEQAGLPLPELNELVAGHEVDCFWRELQLVIELDSSYHDNPLARERDRRRDLDLERAGNRVHRMGPELVYDQPDLTLELTTELLRRRAAELDMPFLF